MKKSTTYQPRNQQQYTTTRVIVRNERGALIAEAVLRDEIDARGAVRPTPHAVVERYRDAMIECYPPADGYRVSILRVVVDT